MHSNASTDGLLSTRSKVFTLAAVCLSALVLPITFTGGAVATPAIGRVLGGSPSELTWVTNAFMLTFGSLLMAAGALADKFGRKRVFTTGMALYAIVSIALCFSSSVVVLDVLRAVQGIAAAAALASGSAALAQEFDGGSRATAFSLLGTTFGVGLAFGPVVAGILIGVFGWTSIFWLTSAMAVIALMLGITLMRETRDPSANQFDWTGSITFTATLALFTFGIIQGPESGWSSTTVVLLLGGSAVTLAAFVAHELYVKHPMLDVSLFRYGRFIGVQMLPIGTCFSYIVLVVFLPLRLIGVEGMTELDAGLLMLALSTPMLVVPMLAAKLTRWVSPGNLSGVGFVVAALGLHWLSYLHVGESAGSMILPMLIIGIGTAMPWGLMDGLAVSVVPKERAGMAAGIFNTARVAGEGITLAIVSAVLAMYAKASLQGYLAGAPSVGVEAVSEAARHLATGSMALAMRSTPSIGANVLSASYDDAFRGLVNILAVVTAASAICAFTLLGKRPRDQESLAVAMRT